VPFGLLASVTIRVLTTLGLWTFDWNAWLLEVWFGLSLSAFFASLPWWRRHLSSAIQATGLWLIVIALSAVAKYGIRIGEMQHTDSANQFALAIIAIQSDTNDLSAVAASPKLGIAFPLMLALGPGGRILSLFPIVVMLSTLALVAWLVRELTENLPRRATTVAAISLGVFSLSVPMFRIATFYVNSHTLMGLAIATMVAGLVLIRRKGVSAQATWLLCVGALVGATTRIEGILLVGLLIALLASLNTGERSQRRAVTIVSMVAGLSLSWWMAATGSPVVVEFGLQTWMLPIVTLIGGLIAGSTVISRVRRWIPLVIGIVLLSLLAREVWASSQPWSTAFAQWPNLALGAGGWATAALVFLSFTILFGWRSQSRDYRWLQTVVWLSIAMIFFSKTFDGGFGRESFYDSVNRMILHVMPLILTVSVVGLAKILSRFESARKESKPKSVSQN
jgi:hypothetical protein